MAIHQAKQCPGRSATEAEQHWYHMPLAPNLGICSCCYHTHLAHTAFAANFGYENDTSGARRVCDFDAPHTHHSLRDAVTQNDFETFKSYWIHRAKIARCPGPDTASTAESPSKWFQLKDAHGAQDFIVCHACHEDYVIPSEYSSHFSTLTQTTESQTLVCDLAWDFCQKLLSGSGEWRQIFSWLHYRKGLPRCTAITQTDGASRRWHRLCGAGLESLLSCEACYYDRIHGSTAAGYFQSSPSALSPNSPVVCMIGGNIPLRVVLDESMRLKDWSIFDRAARIVLQAPPCRAEGTQSAVWYSLIPASAEVDICQACYSCFFESLGAARVLRPKPVPPGELRLCNMNLAAPHVFSLYRVLDIAITQNNPERFAAFIRRAMDVPPCPGNNPVSGRRWHTHDMFSCCPACWLTAPIEGTQLADCFSEEIEVPTQLKCDFYSTRVRDLWRLACIEKNLPEFTQFMEKRLKIWQQTYPLIQQNLQLMKMNAARQATLFMASTINTGANNIAAASGSYGSYGNNLIGYGYETYAGAQGAVQFSQALSMNGSNSGPIAVLAQLEGLWKTVE